jgi:hypothetical protein
MSQSAMVAMQPMGSGTAVPPTSGPSLMRHTPKGEDSLRQPFAMSM